MEKIARITHLYFNKRRYFRLFLIFFICAFWGYIEISDLFPVKEHDLNYHGLKEIKERYKSTPFSFAVLGDPKNSPVFKYIIKALNHDDSLSFAIICGDLVLYPEIETYRAFLHQRMDLRIPSLVLPGNHDVAFLNRNMYYSIFGRFYYSFTLGNAQFIMLDDSNEQNLGDEQTAWLEKKLEYGQKLKYRFVFMHVPLWDPRDSLAKGIRYAHSLKNPDFARKLEDIFIKYHVTILFASHIHSWYQSEKRGLKSIITGGAGAELAGKDPDHTFYHYIKVTLSDNTVKTEVKKLNLKVPFEGIKKYVNLLKLYSLTFAKIYVKYIILGLFIFVLTIDAYIDFKLRKKEGSSTT